MQNGGGGVVAGSPPGSSQLGTSFDSAMGPSAGSSLNGGNGNPGTNGGPNHSAYNNPKNRFLSGDINNREAYIRRQLISIGRVESSEKNVLSA